MVPGCPRHCLDIHVPIPRKEKDEKKDTDEKEKKAPLFFFKTAVNLEFPGGY